MTKNICEECGETFSGYEDDKLCKLCRPKEYGPPWKDFDPTELEETEDQRHTSYLKKVIADLGEYDPKMHKVQMDRQRFIEAITDGEDLSGIDVLNLDLSDMDFCGVDLRNVQNLGNADLSESTWNKKTRFPRGFIPSRHGMLFEDMIFGEGDPFGKVIL